MLDSYKKLQEKFRLPHLQALQVAFQFKADDDSDIDDIRSEISNKLFEFTESVIEPLLWSQHYAHIIERDMLTSDESKSIFELYKQIQSLRWRNNLLTIRPNDDDTARWISDLWIFWSNFERVTGSVCDKFSKGWSSLSFKETETEYHE